MLQWTTEQQALLDIQKAVPMAWRMNSTQLHSFCERLRQNQPQILPGQLGSGFLMLLDEIADLKNEAEPKIWSELMRDTKKMMSLTQQRRDRQDWLHALSRLETQQDQFFQTKLGDSFILALKEKLGLQTPQIKADYSKNNENNKNDKSNQPRSSTELLPQQRELEKVAAWLMEDTGRKRAVRKKQAVRKKRAADLFDRMAIAVLACVSLCLLSVWLYGQVERNQNFWDAQRMKATAAEQQDGAGNKQKAAAGDEADYTDKQASGAESGDSMEGSAYRNNQAAAGSESGADSRSAPAYAAGQGAAAKIQSADAAGSRKRPKILPQYREMAKEYPGLFGWLQIPDTQISLPVMQPLTEPNFYLDHDFTGAESAEGALFADPKNSRWPQDDNIVIYGHNMKNGHIFGRLNQYEDAGYFEAHKEIHFDTIYETGVYEAVAVLKTRILNENEQGFRYYQFFQYENEEEFQQCADFVKNSRLFDTGKSIQYGDKILMLSTCEYSQENGRLVLVARKK